MERRNKRDKRKRRGEKDMMAREETHIEGTVRREREKEGERKM